MQKGSIMGLFFDDLESKRDCVSCRYDNFFLGCEKGKSVGQMDAITCPYFENKYKAQIKKEQDLRNECEKLRQENDELRQENDEYHKVKSKFSNNSNFDKKSKKITDNKKAKI